MRKRPRHHHHLHCRDQECQGGIRPWVSSRLRASSRTCKSLVLQEQEASGERLRDLLRSPRELLSPLFGLIDADLDVGRAPTLGLDEEGEDEDEAAPTALAWSRMDFASALAVGDTLDISFFHLLASSGFTSM